MSANSIQHGGDHYKNKTIEPWDFVAANNIGFFEGNAIKYLTRWREKGGIEDLRKAKHYIDKLIEVELAKEPKEIVGITCEDNRTVLRCSDGTHLVVD